MQCMPGDLAIVVNDFEYPKNNGALLRIWKPALPEQFSIPADWICFPLSTFTFDDRVVGPNDRRTVVYRDQELKPLRDEDGVDESIGWAGSAPEIPQKQEAPVLVGNERPSLLRGTVQRIDRFVSGSWNITLISGNVGFDVHIADAVMPATGVRPGDQILLEGKKGGHPFFGPFIKLCVENG